MNWNKLKFWKREREVGPEARSFVPIGANNATFGSVFSSVLSKCIALYRDTLMATPLKAEKDDDLYKLLVRRPCPFLSRANFYELVIQGYFVFNGFYAYIKTNSKGMIEALLPLNTSPGSLQVYPMTYKKDNNAFQDQSANDWNDSLSLYEKGYYYKDYRGRRFASDEVLAIRSALFNTGTGLIEQEDFAKRVFCNVFESASKIESVVNAICRQETCDHQFY